MTTQSRTSPVPGGTLADTRNSFGARGWSIIGIQGLLIWLAAGAQVHGLNIIVPTLSGHFGIEAPTLLYWATPASWGGVVAAYVVAKMVEARGAKFNIILSLVACGTAFGLLGTWGTVPGFVILFFAVNFFGTGFGYVGGLALIATWFPQKKNLALGWVTMGQTMSTALFVPALAWSFATFGVQKGFWVVTGTMLLMALVVWRFVKNTPEEMGCSPDNVPMSAQEIAASRAEQAAYVSPFSTRRLLAMKDVWLIGIGSGGIYIVLVGVLSQLVPRMMEMGYSQGQAIANLSIAAFIGVPGAYIWGWLGQRFGSRKALMGYAAWWMVAVIVNMVQTNAVVLWISLVMIGLSFGGATNLTTSIVADKFSRGSFVKAFGLIQPIQGVVRTTAYAILAFGLTHLGGYVGAYGLLVAIAVVNIVIFWVVDTTPVEGDTVTETPAAAVA